jgi:hypothetical protein
LLLGGSAAALCSATHGCVAISTSLAALICGALPRGQGVQRGLCDARGPGQRHDDISPV